MRQRQLMRLALAQRRALALIIGLAALGGMALIGQSALLATVIADAFLRHAPLTAVALLLVALLLLALTRAALAWASEVTAQTVSAGVRITLRRRLIERIIARGPLALASERSGELANTTIGGVESLDAYYSQYLPQVALAALIPAMIAVVVVPVDALSGVLLLLTAPLIPIFGALIGDLSAEPARAQWKALSRFSAHFLDVTQGLTTLKIFGRSRRQSETLRYLGEEYRRETMKTLRVAFLSSLALELVSTLSVAVIAVEIGLRLLAGQLSFTRALFVLLLAPEFYLPLRALGARFHAAMSGVTASERIFALLGADGAPPEPKQQGVAPTLALSAPPTISFEHVRYTYPGAQRPALEDISFSVPAGALVALVGPSGAGKSTVLNLLLRFAEPECGAILINGEPLGGWDARVWRQSLSWVSQRPYLFHGTALDNILLARVGASAEDARRAAIEAHADTFIRALPQGYDTSIGEQGARLSGGQAQRIALARAFMRNAPLLLLDEPTAQLDPVHEERITAGIVRLRRGRTTLVVAHRLSTVIAADLILVMDHGRIVASGTHAILRDSSSLYQRLIGASLEEVTP